MVDALDHTASEPVQENVVPATCKEEGSYDSVVYCSVCGEELSKEQKSIEKLPHTEETIPAVPATCTETGLTEGKQCTVCGEVIKAQETVAATGHTWADATCTVPKTCSVCGATEGEELGHNYVGEVTTPATCTTKGEKTYTCSVCGDNYTEEIAIDENAHTLNYDDAHITYHIATCECGYSKQEEHIKEEYCELCHKPAYGESQPVTVNNTLSSNGWANESKHTSLEIDDAVMVTLASKTSTGNTGKYYTSGNDWRLYQTEDAKIKIAVSDGYTIVSVKITYNISNSGTLKFNGSNVASKTVVDVNAQSIEFSVGNTGTKTNGQVRITAIEVIYKAPNVTCDHSKNTNDLSEVTKDPTCTETGIETIKCSYCDGNIETVIPANGHDYKAVVTAPTCTTEGYTTHTCSACGDSYTDDQTDALDHDWDEGTVTTPATCTTTGILTRECKREGCSETKDETIAIAPHTEATIPGTPASCTEIGYTDGVECSVCHAVLTPQEEIPVLGHIDDNSDLKCDRCTENMCKHTSTTTTTVEATCTEAGSITVTCDGCNLVLSTTEIPALNHDEISHEAKASTCTEQGYDAYVTCSRCDYTTRGEDLPLAPHTPVVDEEVKATCLSTGLTQGSHCGVCNVVITEQQIIEKTAHTWGDDTVCDVCKEKGAWTKTDLSNIKATDVVVITWTKGTTTWALPNDGGASTPEAIVIKVAGDKLSDAPADNLKWNIGQDGSNLTIYPNGTTAKWLYCTDSNSGVRVGDNENKVFTIDASSGYLKHTATSRYVGVYTTNPDVRCYTNTTGNTAGQTLAFYVLAGTGEYQCDHANTTTTTVDATCTTDGSTTVVCDDCGETISTETTSATGHSYTDHVCTACGESEPTYTVTVTADEGIVWEFTSGDKASGENGTYQFYNSNVVITINSVPFGKIAVINKDGEETPLNTNTFEFLVASANVTIEITLMDDPTICQHTNKGEWYPDGDENHARDCADCTATKVNTESHTLKTEMIADSDSQHKISCDTCGYSKNVDCTYTDGTCVCGREEPVAAEPTTLATFNLGADGAAGKYDGNTTAITTYNETNNGYSLSLTDLSKVYQSATDSKGQSCLKLGSGSAAGKFTFIVPANVTKVIIYVAQYKANATKIKVNNVSYTITTASSSGAYTAIEVDTSTNKTVSFTTVSGGYRAMVNTIEFIGLPN